MPFEVVVHRELAYQLFGRFLRAFESREYPYNMPWATVPQVPENMPTKGFELGGFAHAHFLFKSCHYMRGGSRSDTAFRLMTEMYHEHPYLFVPRDACMRSPKYVMNVLKEYRLGYKAQEIGVSWVENSRRLVQLWDGDIRNVFRGMTTYEEALSRIQNDKKGGGFRGFQEKMVSMIIYFLMDAGFIDRWNFPLPVDFHVLRTMFAHGIIEPVGQVEGESLYRRDVLAAVRELCATYCLEHGADPLRLCDAMWILSRELCERHPGNSSRVLDEKRRGRSTRFEPVRVVWDYAQTSAYMNSCWACPVESTCRFNVPAADYYVRGSLTRRGFRDKPNLLFARSPMLT